MKKVHFTLVEIMVVMAIHGMLTLIGIPSFSKARKNSQREACINNLRFLRDGAMLLRMNDCKSQTGVQAAPVGGFL